MPATTKTLAPTEERIRLNLVVDPQVKTRIERLQTSSGATSMTEVIRRALALYEELLEIRDEGRQLIVEGGDERERLVVL